MLCALMPTSAVASVAKSTIPVEDGAYPTTIVHAFSEAVVEEESERVITIGISPRTP